MTPPTATAPSPPVITCREDLERGCHALVRVEPRFSIVIEQAGPPPLRLREDGFEALLQAIVSQQLSVAAAGTIWGRLEAAGLTTPDAIGAAGDDLLRSAGLSRQKVRYARALAAAGIDFPGLRKLDDEAVIEQLIEVPGIGRWTAEIYALFSLGRADVFAPADLALQEAARSLFNWPERPREAELRQRALAWQPWRAVAARLLWAWYRVDKKRDGVL